MGIRPCDHSTYRGFRIAYYGTVDERTGRQHNLYFVRDWVGVWNSPDAARAYIDFRLKG